LREIAKLIIADEPTTA